MVEALIFALNAVLPIVLLTALGYFLRQIGLITYEQASGANKLCFHVFLPILLFVNVYETESLFTIHWTAVCFAVFGMTASFFVGMLLVRRLVPDPRQKGVVLQCIFRSNFSILGLPLAMSLFGAEGAQSAAMLSLFAIPLNNILAVTALRMYVKDEKGRGPSAGEIVRDILRNKLILGVLAGLAALLIRALFERLGIEFRLSDIQFLFSALKSAGSVTSPLALIALGAMFTFSSARGQFRQISLAVVMRILIVPGILLTAAYVFLPSLYGAPFAAIIALFGCPVAVSSALMAAEMGNDGELGGQLVVWTTLLSAFTIFFFVTTFRALGALT